MNQAEPRRSVRLKFSLRHLLTLTALIAIGTAVVLAYRKNRSLHQRRTELLSLSSRLQISDEDELASSEMPRVADDFYTWQVNIPSGQEYELRLGMGDVSEQGVPPIVGSLRMPAGQHRVTLRTGDSPSDEFRYVVFIDGEQAIEKTMGRDWMLGGWSSASSMSWPNRPKRPPTPLQLAAQSYTPRLDSKIHQYFNGQSDSYVTRQGYRLWIDRPDRAYDPASPFMGFPNDPVYRGIGLRDGLRYKSSSRSPYDWTFTRPKSGTNDPVLRITADFFASDGVVFSSQTKAFQSWQLRDDVQGEKRLSWQEDPAPSTCTAFLHAVLKSDDVMQPVVEIKWDAGRPDDVGLRIADTPANDQLIRWRLRILDGTKHLWRELQIGDRTINADEAIDKGSVKPSDATVTLGLGDTLGPGDDTSAETHLQWQTNETLPLQFIQRKQNRYAGMGLYNGLPLTLGSQIPATLQPTLAVKIVEQHPDAPGTSFPGGAVFDEIQIDLDAVQHDWIWFRARSKESTRQLGE